MVNKDKQPYALFDQEQDMAELYNLVDSAEHAAVLSEMMARLKLRIA